MTLTQAILLALVQGITEFLPISSSAHLILVPYFVGWRDQGLVFDVLTNAGSLLALLVYFRRDLARLLSPRAWGWRSAAASADGRAPAASAAGSSADRSSTDGSSAAGSSKQRIGARSGPPDDEATGVPIGPALALGTVPVVVAGLLLIDWVGGAARNAELIALTSIGFGLLLYWADRGSRGERGLADLTWRDVMVIGLAEALALVPGTSRSGITITAGLFLGLHREAAARFSFLLAVPVGLAATAVDVRTLWLEGPGDAGWLPLAVGFGVSALSAYLVIGWLLSWVRRQTMTVFVVYRVALGVLILAVAALGR